MNKTTNEVQELILDKLTRYFAITPDRANEDQIYKAISLVVRDLLLQKKQENNKRIAEGKYKRVYYICMEFLIGRSLKNNLFNLGLTEQFDECLKNMNFSLENIFERESDAGLGNGGLGRLASCFMDSLATKNYPAMGFTIRYQYGLFRQRIVDNQQVELPDMWLPSGEVWMMPRSDKRFTVNFGGRVEEYEEDGRMRVRYVGGESVDALANDVMISGYGDNAGVSVLRLWSATSSTQFDMHSFSQGDYEKAMRRENDAELISKVLYPADDHSQGKQLRLQQEYFLVSASLQSIIKDHLRLYKSVKNLPDKAVIHANDTHPALAIPELMRLLMDEHGFSWDDAWDITTRTVNYTNHTVMAEALEKWDETTFRMVLPRIYAITCEINRRFVAAMEEKQVDRRKIDAMRILHHNQVKMANLCVIGSQKINGVSALHSEIIKDTIFSEFNEVYPDRFTNVTNGITHRRWLIQSNPRLSSLITELIGPDFYTKPETLSGLTKYTRDKAVLEKIGQIKQANKKDYADYIKKTTGFVLNPESRFDTQIKRLHEYKRQLLNVLKIVHYYLELLDNPNKNVAPQTFIFGAKAAGSYMHAKRIIQLINCLSAEIQKNPKIKKKLDVMFVENYNVTQAEHLIPASEISEQISLAGKEASGTGNMKFMINGAITLGTLDGANVEIGERVGSDNIFIFGLKTEEVERAWRAGYNSSTIYTHNNEIKRVVDRLRVGFDGESFSDIADYLISGSYQVADPYMCLLDFDDYINAADKMGQAYADKAKWNKMALINIAQAGIFSSDRAIHDYAKNIWNLKKVKPLNN
ncbi:MAG: glycogen/starch/alpha-glucan phosphorylase [Clostridiales bacterium]|nr:glycogen/starch/alpha-glucan phosphorylase [Clostridiales bacterium]